MDVHGGSGGGGGCDTTTTTTTPTTTTTTTMTTGTRTPVGENEQRTRVCGDGSPGPTSTTTTTSSSSSSSSSSFSSLSLSLSLSNVVASSTNSVSAGNTVGLSSSSVNQNLLDNKTPISSSTIVNSHLTQSNGQQRSIVNATPRLFSRNVNGTLVQTSVPQNEAELQLYRVMQRASLLGYYDTLLEMGGDDVQQLCDAGEEEFLEIMALVGMASKPLHVRRLQKALQEWINNPSLFQTPVMPSNTTTTTSVGCGGNSSLPLPFPSSSTRVPVSSHPRDHTSTQQQQQSVTYNGPLLPLTPLPPSSSSSPVVVVVDPTHTHTHTHTPTRTRTRTQTHANVTTTAGTNSSNTSSTIATYRRTPSPSASLSYPNVQSPGSILQMGTCESSCGSGTTPSPVGCTNPGSPNQPIPTLLQSQVQRLSDAAERLTSSPNYYTIEPKPHNVKKKICKNIEVVMGMSENDPQRMEEIRKYAAIYGRFDCKRKPEKPLTLHEVLVNEAAAQICKFVPAFLTRREDLFRLARNIVRDSGFHYSKSQYISTMTRPRDNGDDEIGGERTKRYRFDLENESEDSSQALLDIGNSARKRRRSRSPVWLGKSNGMFDASPDASDSDTQLSSANEEPLSLHDANEEDVDNSNEEGDFNLKVIASRGDDIIAVANPALKMSSPGHANAIECSGKIQIKEETTNEKSQS